MCVNIYVRERLTEDWFQMPSGRSIPGGLDHGPSIATCKMMKNKRQPSKTFENCVHTYVYMHMQACTNTR
jgi:hypothetical protein